MHLTYSESKFKKQAMLEYLGGGSRFLMIIQGFILAVVLMTLFACANFNNLFFFISAAGVTLLDFVTLKDRRFTFGFVHIILAAMCIMLTVSFFFGGLYSAKGYFNNLAMWFNLLYITSRCYSAREVKQFVGAYLMGISIAALGMVISNPVFNSEIERSMVACFGVEFNINVLPYFSVPAIVISILRFFKRPNPQSIFLILLHSYVLLYAQTRGAFLSLVVSVALLLPYLAITERNKKRVFIFIGLILAAMAAMFLPFYLLGGDYVLRIFNFSNSSGRTDLWQNGINMLTEPLHWIFGRGFGYYVANGGDNPIVPFGLHNLYVQLTVQAGVICAAIALIFVLSVIVKTKSAVLWSVAATACISTMFENGDSGSFTLPVVVVLLIANTLRETRKSKAFAVPQSSADYLL